MKSLIGGLLVSLGLFLTGSAVLVVVLVATLTVMLFFAVFVGFLTLPYTYVFLPLGLVLCAGVFGGLLFILGHVLAN